MELPFEVSEIFSIDSPKLFNEYALRLFQFQVLHNKVYRDFVELLKVDIKNVQKIEQIPFLPIEFFKTHEVISSPKTIESFSFLSSGTTQQNRSEHIVNDIDIYVDSYLKGFQYFYGDISDYIILALLPSYIEQGNSSLVYMVDDLIKKTNHQLSGFYLADYDKLHQALLELKKNTTKKVMLIGVSYALLDLIEQFPIQFPELIVMETGGMKGRRSEITKDEFHHILKSGFGVENIHSEYGMTELLSQGYSFGNGNFKSVPWMKVLIRDISDPLNYQVNSSGIINVIDLANIHSCAFISTKDIGKYTFNGDFQVLGRADYSDMRGCNLMVQ